MASIIYEGKEYKSKADLLRNLYEIGKLKNDSYSKNQIAKELGIAVQTVHATLIKVLENCSNKVKSVIVKKDKEGKIKEKIHDVIIVRHGEEIVGNKGKLIKIICAPNQWGLPITNPPIYVIDPSFKGKDTYESIKENLNVMDELIQY